jgi:hypothetical protein
MITAYILLVVALAVLGFWIWAAKGRGLALRRKEAAEIHPVDLDAFRNLMDPSEEEYLRHRLSASEFRAVQRRRLLAAIEYITCVAKNASALLTVGEAARANADPQVALAGQQLVEAALQLRLYAIAVIAKFYMAILLPGLKISPASVADRYQNVAGILGTLRRLQYPNRAARIPAAI